MSVELISIAAVGVVLLMVSRVGERRIKAYQSGESWED